MRFDRVLCVLFWMTLLQGTASLCCRCRAGSRCRRAATSPWIVVVGVTGLSAHYSLTSALGHAPASIVAPMEFIRLPLIALVGTWLYGEQLSARSSLGAALIIAGNLINLRPKTRRAPGLRRFRFCCTCEYARRRAVLHGWRAMIISKIEPGVNPPES